MQAEGVVREQLVAVLEKARRLIEDVRAGRRPPLGEQNTKAVLIEPVLAALGWDPMDPAEVFREYSESSAPGRVDYALLVEGTPALFVEAKDLRKDLSDRNSLTQILRYAWMTRVPCCLLANGDDYHLYAVRRSQREDDEVALRVRVSDAGEADATAARLALMSKESVRDGHLDKCLGWWRVDRRVEPGLLDLLKPDSPTLVRWLRRQLRDLSPAQIRESLGRAHVRVEFPAGPAACWRGAGERPPPEKAKGEDDEPSAEGDWGVRAFRGPLQIEVGTDVILLTKWRPLRKEIVAQRVSMETVRRTAESACALAARGAEVFVPAIRREPTGPSALGSALRGVAALLLADALPFARASAHAEYFTVPPGLTPEKMVAKVRQAAETVEPSRRSAAAGAVEAERHALRRRFWTQLLERAAKTTQLHSGVTPGKENWLATGAGRRGLSLCYVVREHDAHVELYIDRGKGSDAWNTSVFEQLRSSRQSVEAAFGRPLEWQALPGKRACRIRSVVGIGGYRDGSEWPEVHEAMIDAMVRLEKALRPRIAQLNV